MDKLEVWFDQISAYDKLKISEAKELYKKIISTNDLNTRKKYMDELINGTLYVVLNFIKNNNLEILENSCYDMDDIVATSIEYFIDAINEGKLLNIESFGILFGSPYYSYLTSVFVPQKENVETSRNIGLNHFGELMEVYLYLKSNKDEVSFKEYLKEIKNTKSFYRYDEYYFCSITAYFYECFKVFENIYSKVNIDDNNIPSRTKLTFLRHMLIEISSRENLKENMQENTDFENKTIKKLLINNSIDYIFNQSDLSEKEVDVIFRRNGITDGETRTLEQVASVYGTSRERIRQIEAKAYRKLRKLSKSKYLYNEGE